MDSIKTIRDDLEEMKTCNKRLFKDCAEDTDTAKLKRELGKPKMSSFVFSIGRLQVHCFGGWCKVEVLGSGQDSEAELLNPELTCKLLNWLGNVNS